MRNLVPNPFSTTGAVEETLVEVPSYSKGRARRARKKRRWGRCCKQRRYHTAYRWYCVWCHKNENTSTCSCTLCKCHHAPQTVPFSLKESIQETWKTLKQGWSGLTDVVSAVGLWLGRITRLVTPQSTTATPASGGEEDGGVVQREGVDAEAGRRAEEKKGGTEDGAGREDGRGENTSTCSCTLCKCHHAPQTVPFSLKESIQETWKTLKQGWSGLTDVVSAVGLWLGRITRLVTPQSTTATPASGGEEDGGVVQREGVDAEAGRRAEEKKGGTEDGAGREDGGGGVTRKRGRRKRKKKGRGRGRGNKKKQIPHAVEEKKPATAHKLFG